MGAPPPTSAQQREYSQAEARALSADQTVSVDIPGSATKPERPPVVSHLSTPSYDSPLRHHKRQPSVPREVKETLNARSEYTNSEDDGTAIHHINQYIIKQEIGRGSFGAVHRAVDQYNQEYAVKEFSKSRLRKRAQSNILRRPDQARKIGPIGMAFNSPLHRRSASDIHDQEEAGNPLYLIREEIAIMKKLNHNNLAALYEVLDDPSEDSLYMVMEMCKKGVVMKIEMGDRADPYDPESCRCWFRDLILGVEYLHAQGVVHRDIKPDNLLLTDDDVLKIVDFGVSEMFEKSSDMTTKKSAGSPAFLPPELCVTKHGAISGKAVDIWSMGVTLYCLYYGQVPFEKPGVLDLYESIKNEPLDLSSKDSDGDFKDLMHKLLEKDPEKRIRMEELRDHPWVTKRGVDPLLSAEENTSDPVQPPTAEELNRAITGNLSNLLVVMKAVRKFRNLLTHKRPYLMDSVLGGSARLVQPPLSLDSASRPLLSRSGRSDDAADRRPVEQALTAEGVHRRVKPEMDINVPQRTDGGVMFDRPRLRDLRWRSNIVEPTPLTAKFPNNKTNSPHRVDSGAVMGRNPPRQTQADPNMASPPPDGLFQSPDQDTYLANSLEKDNYDERVQSFAQIVQSPDQVFTPPPAGPSNRTPHSADHTGKGQAHDPLAEFHFLHIGPGVPEEEEKANYEHYTRNGADITHNNINQTVASSDQEREWTVCESPPATDDNIYDKAYDEEIERIRANSMDATMYLTRRVQDASKYTHAKDVVGEWAHDIGNSLHRLKADAEASVAARDQNSDGPRRQHTAPALAMAALGNMRERGENRFKESGVQEMFDGRKSAAKGMAVGGVGNAAQRVGAFAGAVQGKMKEVQEQNEKKTEGQQ